MSSKIKSAAKKLVNGLNAGKIENVHPIEGLTETNISLSEVEKLMLDCGFQLGNEYGDMAVEYNRDVIFGRRKTLVTVLQVVSDSCDEENGWCIDSPLEEMMYFGKINNEKGA